jgi:excisionase family DNA binding protein
MKAGQGKGAGRSYIKPGADPSMPRDCVGVNAPESHSTVDMRVQVDQTRGDVLSGCVDDLECSLGWDRTVHRGDTTRPDCDIKLAVIVTGRINHLSALNQQIETHCLCSLLTPSQWIKRHTATVRSAAAPLRRPQQPGIAPDGWLTFEEAAWYLKRTPKAFEKIVAKGEIPKHYLTERGILFSRKELDEWPMGR